MMMVMSVIPSTIPTNPTISLPTTTSAVDSVLSGDLLCEEEHTAMPKNNEEEAQRTR
jgi:hypothetical protein